MAMLRRLQALGTKSGSDPAAQLLRSLSTRSGNNNNSSSSDAAGGAVAADEHTAGGSPTTSLQQRNHRLGAIGPASKSRYSFGGGNSSPNRGLSGLAGTGFWSGGDAISGGVGAARSLSSGTDPSAQEDEESSLSSLLHELDDIRNNAVLDDLDDEIDMDETVDAPPSQPQGKPMDFEAYGLNSRLQQQLRKVGVDKFFPVQAQCFEKVVEGKDLMCKSRTGSGKTLAFAIPIIEALDRQSVGEAVQMQRGGRGRHFSKGAYGRLPRAICVAPTRELAKQVEREFNRIAPELNSLAVYGGTASGPQIGEMRRGVDIIVGTPGRIIDHIEQGNLNLSEIQFCVLDEADLMLQMGFQEPVEEIFKEMPENKQTTLWSATMPRWVQQLSRKYLKSPEFIDLVGEDDAKIPSTITHWSYATQRDTRSDILGLVATVYGAGKRSIVFTQTKAEVDELCTHPALSRLGAEALHGGLSQAAREACLDRFRSGRTKMIVATDVAARGLDIPGVDMVFHYRLPNDKESFVHRSGRTGRAGKAGLNIILCSHVEDRQLAALEGDYSFKSFRRSPPSGASNIEEMVDEMKEKILSVSAASVRMFKPQAADLLTKLGLTVAEESSSEGEGGAKVVPVEGVQALSAAMSLIGGDAGITADSYSMIDGTRGMQSLLVSGQNIRGQRDAGDVVQFINSSMIRPNVMRYRICEGGLLVDVPSNAVDERMADIKSRLTDMKAGGISKRTFEGMEVSVPVEVAGALDTRGGSFDSLLDRGRFGGGGGGGRGGGQTNSDTERKRKADGNAHRTSGSGGGSTAAATRFPLSEGMHFSGQGYRRVVDNRFEVLDTLGTGYSGKVKRAINHQTGEVVALKVIKKLADGDPNSARKSNRLQREVDAMRRCAAHPHTVVLKESFNKVYPKKNGQSVAADFLVLELCEKGELFDLLLLDEEGPIPAVVCKEYFRQLMSGIKFCHDQGVYHRDLKPENLLLDSDFTLKMMCQSIVGSTKYMAPEVLNRRTDMYYDPRDPGYDGAKADVWSAGVILFMMLAGHSPMEIASSSDWWFRALKLNRHDLFWEAHEKTLNKGNASSTRLSFPEDVKHLVSRMLTVEPAHRISVDQIMGNPYLTAPRPNRHFWGGSRVEDPRDVLREVMQQRFNRSMASKCLCIWVEGSGSPSVTSASPASSATAASGAVPRSLDRAVYRGPSDGGFEVPSMTEEEAATVTGGFMAVGGVRNMVKALEKALGGMGGKIDGLHKDGTRELRETFKVSARIPEDPMNNVGSVGIVAKVFRITPSTVSNMDQGEEGADADAVGAAVASEKLVVVLRRKRGDYYRYRKVEDHLVTLLTGAGARKGNTTTAMDQSSINTSSMP
eukprot:g14271.t2